MEKHRTHSIEVSGGFAGVSRGAGGACFVERHDVSRNLIRGRVKKYQAGALYEDIVNLTATALISGTSATWTSTT